jgi:group I intron endonuclease
MINFFENKVIIKPSQVKGVSGIYKIVNQTNGKFYLGRASDLYNRITVHLCHLRRGTEQHKTSSLGSAWRKYGEECFFVEIIERVESNKDLPRIEQEYLNALTPWVSGIGYNQDKHSTGFTSETAKAVMLEQKLKGRSWKHEENSNAKLSLLTAQKIRSEYLEGATTKLLTKKYNVSLQTISEVLKGKRWVDGEDIIRDKKLDLPTRKKIAELYGTGRYTYIQLAEIFNCSKDSIGRAVRAK